MIEYDIFYERLTTRRCLKSNRVLLKNDYLISSKEFINLYQNIYSESEYQFIKNIISCIHSNNKSISLLDEIFLTDIQLFFNLLITSDKKYTKERVIHLYIFLFWDKLIGDIEFIGKIKKEELLYEGQVIDQEDKFQKNLLPYISNNCDLIYYDYKKSLIELIEIKNVDLDDRAISQIQRYYRNTNLICETIDHQLSILYLRPTLILRHDNLIQNQNKTSLLDYWQTFPTYFKELLNVYSFEFCYKNETLKLINLKPKLKSLLKNK
ncbi:hypothetical protein AB0W27_06325 [Aliarcobacter butzleri]|uniref:hypothetical protein n=1 Tax=Aliarcobacter butzleri TaxID=28197 RepID=UPI00344BCC9B